MHIAGKSNRLADVLSKMHQKDKDETPKLTPLISPDAFLSIFEADDPRTVEHEVMEAQVRHQSTMEQWEKTLPIEKDEELGRITWRDKKGRLIVPLDDAQFFKIGRAHV